MQRSRRMRAGLLLGAGLGALLFIGDLTGATLAIGFLFDARAGTFVMVALAGLTTTAVGTATGGLIGVALPLGVRPRIRPAALVAVGAGLFAAAAGIGFAGRAGRRPQPPGPPPALVAERPAPVLWVVIDTLRADTLYGEGIDFPLAPKMRAFASQSFVFTDAEAAAGWTMPSMATLLTGLHPTALHAARHIPAWAPTVAERLRAAGYETHAVVDNALLERRNGYTAGFQSYLQKSGLRFAFSLPGFRLMGAWARRKLRERFPVYYHGAPGVTDRALAILAAECSAPLFLYVHYMDPHYPYYPHPELGPDPLTAEPVTLPWKTLRQQNGELRPGQLQFLRSRYAGETRIVDRELGRLLDAWQGAYGRSGLVLIVSDHGEEFLDHGSLGHGSNLHTELVRVPLILQLPGIDGRRIDHPVGLVDLLPTTLDVLGIPQAVGGRGVEMHGRSWLAWLAGDEPAPGRSLLAKQDFRGRQIVRIRQGPWVRIRTVEPEAGRDSVAVYDKETDDREMRDVSARRPVERQRLAAMLDRLTRATQPQGERGDTDRADNEETLRALGYIQ